MHTLAHVDLMLAEELRSFHSTGCRSRRVPARGERPGPAAGRDLYQAQGLVDLQVTGRLIACFARLSSRPAPRDVDRLTPREHEVPAHGVRNLGNAEVAAALTIEEGTVKTHGARILTELGVRTRVHAVIYAYEQGLTG